MTIDEAIALVKIERECVIRADVCDRKCEKCDLLQDSIDLTDMYEQLAEWLEELKFIRQWKSDVMDEFCKYDCNSVEEVRHNAYNKAIDDCIKIVKFHRDSWDGIEWAIRDIEELKEGGENEQSI